MKESFYSDYTVFSPSDKATMGYQKNLSKLFVSSWVPDGNA